MAAGAKVSLLLDAYPPWWRWLTHVRGDCSQRALHATPTVAKKGDISASELSSILQEKIEGMSSGVKIDEVRAACFISISR
eukprot:SAG31_NODE_2576_length_5452_cov_2.351018_2_plen_81_part_00